jgi:hypothetical protein
MTQASTAGASDIIEHAMLCWMFCNKSNEALWAMFGAERLGGSYHIIVQPTYCFTRSFQTTTGSVVMLAFFWTSCCSAYCLALSHHVFLLPLCTWLMHFGHTLSFAGSPARHRHTFAFAISVSALVHCWHWDDKLDTGQ